MMPPFTQREVRANVKSILWFGVLLDKPLDKESKLSRKKSDEIASQGITHENYKYEMIHGHEDGKFVGFGVAIRTQYYDDRPSALHLEAITENIERIRRSAQHAFAEWGICKVPGTYLFLD
jgi:hypothetical protein